MSKNTIIGSIAIVVFVIGVIYIVSETRGTAPLVTPPTNPGSSNNKSYTLATVATHNSQSSCWTTISGKVYDLTTWIGQHPGGEQAIISICGKDGTSAFLGQHGGQQKQAD